jgi:Ulp1 family protease
MMEPLSLDDCTQNTTASAEKFLVYLFVCGDKIELAAKDLSLCDFKGVYNDDALITLQLDHTVGKSHILTFTKLDRETLKPRTWVNDTVIDFWFHWIARNEPFYNNVLTLTSHFFSTLRNKNGVEEVSRWMRRRKNDAYSKHLIMFSINIDNVKWSFFAICNLQNFSTVMEGRIKNNGATIPVMIHLDSYGLHTTGEIGNIV